MTTDKFDSRVALLSVITGHRMIGHDEKNAIEKICECGQRFVGLLAHDLHEKEMQEEAVKAIFAAGQAAPATNITVAQEEAQLLSRQPNYDQTFKVIRNSIALANETGDYAGALRVIEEAVKGK